MAAPTRSAAVGDARAILAERSRETALVSHAEGVRPVDAFFARRSKRTLVLCPIRLALAHIAADGGQTTEAPAFITLTNVPVY